MPTGVLGILAVATVLGEASPSGMEGPLPEVCRVQPCLTDKRTPSAHSGGAGWRAEARLVLCGHEAVLLEESVYGRVLLRHLDLHWVGQRCALQLPHLRQ